MRVSFASQRLHGLLTTQAFGAGGALVACVVDMIVAGNLVGVDALAGIAAVLPVLVGAQFLARLVYCGAGYQFAKYQGLMDRERTRRVVGLSLEAAAVVGLAFFAVTALGRDLYLDYMGLSGNVREQAVLYWRWIMVYHSISPLTMTMWWLVYADGETVVTAIADTTSPFLTIVLSVVFTRMTGTAAGAALGVLVGLISADMLSLLHLLRKSNAVVPTLNFSWRGLWEIVSYSLTDSVAKLCQCGFVAVVSKLVVFSASVAYLPVVSMVALVQQLCDILNRIGNAYTPIAAMYLGERNLPRLRELARHSLLIAVVVGVLLLAVVELLAPQIVTLYGIPRGDVFDSCVIVLRGGALALPIASVLLFLCSHYLVLGRIALSVTNTVLMSFLLTASSAVAFCLAWGVGALGVGLPAGVILTLIAVAVYCWAVERQRPLLIPADRNAVLNLTFTPDAGRIVRARDEGERFLRTQGVGSETVARIMLLVEECAMSAADACRRAERMSIEASFLVDGDAVTLVLRDTGEARDVTDGDAQVTSLRSFVIAGLMRSYENRRYLNTIGCNRAVFSFVSGVAHSH